MNKIVFFDLEGPLSPQDNALEVMGLVDKGHQAFAVISRYDDLLALEGREEYEPGDTLKLILPFLVLHGITAEDIENVSKAAPLIAGASELVASLVGDDWRVHIISTSYQQHALRIAAELGIPERDVACTRLDLADVASRLGSSNLGFVREAWDYLLRIGEGLSLEEIADGAADARIRPRLDAFYWETMPRTPLGEALRGVEVVGGRRKVGALERFCHGLGVYLGQVAVVGDSITDFQMLKAVEAAGGLAIVFNGNRYALPFGTVSVASVSLLNLLPVLRTWVDSGREALRKAVLCSDLSPQEGDAAYHWLVNCPDLEEVAGVHSAARKRARGEGAGSLG
jgi:energy-converting hydrogenase A subunit R